MALNAEPADPTEREQQGLPSKSYSEAAEEALTQEDPQIDEDAIKESPPRVPHIRNSSEPRPFGEVIDEPTPGSPSLRHPRGRLEHNDSRESYADIVKEDTPGSKTLGTANGTTNGNGVRHAAGDKTPERFDGIGGDEAPRSPTRRVHKRVSSRSMNGHASRSASSGLRAAEDNTDATVSEKTTSEHTPKAKSTDEQTAKPGSLVYENFRNKSGENLASIKPGFGYEVSLKQREDKLQVSKSSSEPGSRPSSELVSGRHAGAGWSASAIRWAPLNVPLQRRLQTAVVLMHTLSIAGGLALFLLLCAIPLLWPILLPYLIYILFSKAGTDGKLSYRSEWLRSSKLWSLFGSYYPARLHRSDVLEPTRKYIFGYHPHGIISHGAFAAFATEALGFSQLFPGITNTLLTLDSNFRIPLYREYALRMGLASVSRESCENLLNSGGPNGEGMGRAITIVIGGARESLDAKPYYLRLVLQRRKGFVKLAIRTGADLVPVLSFGENDLYDQLESTEHPYVHKAQTLLKKFMGFTIPLFHARGVFNYDVGIMPYRRPMNLVVGKPIRIMQNKNPDPAYVDEIHAKYVEELLRIWDEWKDVFAENRRGELEIIE